MKTKLLFLSILFALFSLVGLSAQEKAYAPILSAVPEDIEKWMDQELAKVKKEPIKDYESDRFFSKEPAKLIGYIKGYDPKVGFNTGIYYASNELTREDYPVTIEIQPNGRFEAEIPLIHPTTSFIEFNNKLLDFYLEPGQTLGMVLDWEKFLEAERHNSRYYPQDAVVFKGKLARINEEITSLNFSPFNYSDFKKNVLTLNSRDIKKVALEEKKKNEELLANYISENSLLERTETILTNKKDLITATLIFNYFMYKKDLQRQHPDNEILKEEIPVDQYSFLQSVPMNKQSLLINQEFSEFVNRFEFAEPLSNSGIYEQSNSITFTPEKSLKEYFDEHNISLSEEERKALNPIHNSMEEINQHNERYKKFQAKYSEELEKYRDLYITPFMADLDKIFKDYMTPWHKKDSVMTNHLHLENDLVYDITKIRSLDFQLGTIKEAEEASKFWNDLSETIENKFLIEEGERLIQQKFPKQKKSIDGLNKGIVVRSEIISLPNGEAKNLFYKIADQHKNKILFVDFWATSCGPCVATIKNMKETRKKYKGNPDFDFVFITDQRLSPLKGYENFTKQQELENIYRVDTDTYNRFRQLFKFNGIPKYVVLNKEGEVIDDDFEMHLFNTELPEILRKNK